MNTPPLLFRAAPRSVSRRARMRRRSCLISALASLAAGPLMAATSITVTNDWASAKVHIVTPKPNGSPPLREWKETQFGAASIDLKIQQSSNAPGDYFAGSAFAVISPTLNLSYVSISGGTQLFASRVLADDTSGCEAEAIIDSVWTFTVAGDPVGFYANAVTEGGHTVKFMLHDLSTGLLVASLDTDTGGYRQSGNLEAGRNYQVVMNEWASFGKGDGNSYFGFGFTSPADIIFSPTRTHLAVPEPSHALMVAAGALLALRRRRK